MRRGGGRGDRREDSRWTYVQECVPAWAAGTQAHWGPMEHYPTEGQATCCMFHNALSFIGRPSMVDAPQGEFIRGHFSLPPSQAKHS